MMQNERFVYDGPEDQDDDFLSVSPPRSQDLPPGVAEKLGRVLSRYAPFFSELLVRQEDWRFISGSREWQAVGVAPGPLRIDSAKPPMVPYRILISDEEYAWVYDPNSPRFPPPDGLPAQGRPEVVTLGSDEDPVVACPARPVEPDGGPGFLVGALLLLGAAATGVVYGEVSRRRRA